MISVVQRPVVLASSSSPLAPDLGQTVTWNVLARDLINGSPVNSLSISQYIDGVLASPAQTDSTGSAVFTHAFSNAGSHSISFTSAQTSIYTSASIQSSIVALLPTSLNLQGPNSVIVGQQNSFTAILKDSNNNPLSSRILQIRINGAWYANLTTSGDGSVQFVWTPQKTGAYFITASFSAQAPADLGYKPSTNSLAVNVIPQSITNSQSTSSGTQSVNFMTAQGAPSTSPFQVSISFPDPFTLTVTVQANGRQAQASSHIANLVGINCTWRGCWPYWNVQVSAAITGVLNYVFTGAMVGGITSANVNVLAAPPNDIEAANNGVTASTAVGAVGFAALLFGGFYAGAIAVQIATIAALGVGGGLYGSNLASLESYLFGLLFPIALAFPCVVS